jgi:hypothetical protein
MFDKASGRYYAMLLLSTLLGISERYHPVSCTALVYNARLGGYVADIDPSSIPIRLEQVAQPLGEAAGHG